MKLFIIICDLAIWKDVIIPAAAVIITGIAAIVAVVTYTKNTRQHRFEFFNSIFNKYLDDERTKKLQELFIKEEQIIKNKTQDDTVLNELKNYPQTDKYFLLGLFEQVAIALKSGLIKKEVAHYMFGYFSIRTYDSENFWYNLQGEKESKYWKIFSEFVEDMKKIDQINTGKIVY